MVLFIAEISSNHGQDINRCFDFIDKAAEIGCDVVKFQLFRVDLLFSKEAMKEVHDLIGEKSKEDRSFRGMACTASIVLLWGDSKNEMAKLKAIVANA